MGANTALSGDRSVMLQILSFQPVPKSTHAIQKHRSDGWWTTISRVFKDGEEADCRLCPAHLCGVDEHGHCLVQVPCYVPDVLAPTFPLDGDTGLDGPPLANRVADSG